MGDIAEVAKELYVLALEGIFETGINADGLRFGDNAFKAVSWSIWNYLYIFAIALTLIYFLIEINKRWALEGDHMSVKTMFAPFLKLACALVVISNADTLMGYVLNINNSFVAWASETFSRTSPSTAGFSAVVEDIIDGHGLFYSVILVIPGLILYVVGLIPKLIFSYKAILYKLEVIFRFGFTPIAMADIYSGMNSSASRWLKGFFALGLYGMSFVIIPCIGSSLIMDTAGTLLGGLQYDDAAGFIISHGIGIWEFIKLCCQALLIPFAELGMLNIAKSATREAVGV